MRTAEQAGDAATRTRQYAEPFGSMQRCSARTAVVPGEHNCSVGPARAPAIWGEGVLFCHGVTKAILVHGVRLKWVTALR